MNSDVRKFDPKIHDRRGTKHCFRCNKRFKEGDKIIIRRRKKYYHLKCFYAEGKKD